MDERAEADILAELSTDFFLLAEQISAGGVELPSCDTFRRRMLQLFESMKNDAHRAGVLPPDIEDAQYALAAYLDEVIQYSDWPGKQEWAQNPLQAALFEESRAGTNFFQRLEDVRRRNPAVLQVYYYCMALGFMGEYRFGGDERRVEALINDIKRELMRGRSKQLSEHGKRPADRSIAGKSLPLLPTAGACLLVALLIAVVLYFIVSYSSGEATDLLTRMGRSS